MDRRIDDRKIKDVCMNFKETEQLLSPSRNHHANCFLSFLAETLERLLPGALRFFKNSLNAFSSFSLKGLLKRLTDEERLEALTDLIAKIVANHA
jgi:hypothetical protein